MVLLFPWSATAARMTRVAGRVERVLTTTRCDHASTREWYRRGVKLLGTQPAHWDAESFEYELRFDAPPNDAQVEALAHAWSEHVEKGPTIGAGWRFAGPFAYFDVRPRKDPRPMFTHVEAFVRRANEIAPIVEVVPVVDAWLIFAGGLLYTAGVVFHLWDSLKFQNAIWHGFVLSAAFCHFAALSHASFSVFA